MFFELEHISYEIALGGGGLRGNLVGEVGGLAVQAQHVELVDPVRDQAEHCDQPAVECMVNSMIRTPTFDISGPIQYFDISGPIHVLDGA